MPAPATNNDFLDLARKSQQIDVGRLEAYLDERRQSDTLPPDPKKLAALLVKDGLLTGFQAEQFLQGKYKGFQLGGYRILERLGTGGTGTVFLAEHEVMKRPVALKVLPPAFANDQAILERFRREAQAGAALDDPNIVRAYDFRHDAGVYYLVLEYVNGPSLAEVLERGGPLDPAVACDYVRQAALGLDHAHQAGLVHRDVKPGNLLVDGTGTVKVLDLGLARFAPDGQASLTRQFDENTVMGTADYIAPEQALNLHEVDARADIYSLGATLYALIAGEAPFSSGSMTQKLLWHQMRDPVPLTTRRPACPPEVAEVVVRMMAKAPEDRYPNCAEVAEALTPFAAEAPTPQGPPRPGGAMASGGASYVRGRTKPKSAMRQDATPAPAKPRSATRRDGVTPPAPREEAPEPEGIPRPRIATDVRLRPKAGTVPASEGMGLALMTMLVGGIMLVIGGVVALLLFAPSPNAAQPANKADAPEVLGPKKPTVAFRLPDGNGELFALNGHQGSITGLLFAKSGEQVLSSSADGTVRVWDLIKRQSVHTITVSGHGATSVAAVHDGLLVVGGAGDGGAVLYDMEVKRVLRWFPKDGGRTHQVAFGINESHVMIAAADGAVRVYDSGSGNRVKMIKDPLWKAGGTRAVAPRPHKPSEAVVGGEDGHVLRWDVSNQKVLRPLRRPAPKPASKDKDKAKAKAKPQTRPAHSAACLAATFTADGKRVLTAGEDGVVCVWEADSGKLAFTFTAHKTPVNAVAASPDGLWAASVGDDRALRIWGLGATRTAKAYPAVKEPLTAVAMSPDGRHVATGGAEGLVRLWAIDPWAR